jgi:hypothetical protein
MNNNGYAIFLLYVYTHVARSASFERVSFVKCDLPACPLSYFLFFLVRLVHLSGKKNVKKTVNIDGNFCVSTSKDDSARVCAHMYRGKIMEAGMH